MPLVPPHFSEAETDHPDIAQWCSTILAGDTARLLLLEPHWSGKSHTAYARLRRLLTAGYREENITVHQAHEHGRSYDPSMIENTTPITVIDDLPLSNGLMREAKVPLKPGSGDVQAMTALEAGALADAVTRLSLLPRRSWPLIVSNLDCLTEAAGQEATDRLVAVAEQAELTPAPARPCAGNSRTTRSDLDYAARCCQGKDGRAVAKRMNGSEKNRKEPVSDVARRLWAFSGNECAWGDPHCSTRLVTDEGAWIGKIAHIIGAEPGSARHEAWDGKDAEQLRDFDNLMLLCGNHHDLIDSSVTRRKYTVEYLRAVKEKHEGKYRYTVDDIEAEFRDTVNASLVRPATTMRRFFAWEDANQDPEDEQDTLELVNRFAGRVGGLTRRARQVLALVVHEQTTDFELVMRRFSADRTTLLSVVHELQKAEMVYLHDEEHDEDRGQLSLLGGALEDVYEMWDEFRGFCLDQDIDLKEVLVDLNFSRLD